MDLTSKRFFHFSAFQLQIIMRLAKRARIFFCPLHHLLLNETDSVKVGLFWYDSMKGKKRRKFIWESVGPFKPFNGKANGVIRFWMHLQAFHQKVQFIPNFDARSESGKNHITKTQINLIWCGNWLMRPVPRRMEVRTCVCVCVCVKKH